MLHIEAFTRSTQDGAGMFKYQKHALSQTEADSISLHEHPEIARPCRIHLATEPNLPSTQQ